MASRETILAELKKNQPALQPLPDISIASPSSGDLKARFIQTLTGIGGNVIELSELGEITSYINKEFSPSSRIINTKPELNLEFEILNIESEPHVFKDVSLAIIQGDFGVAENGAIWLTDANMGDQALPYICEHLALIINSDSILETLHDAYEKIGAADYRLGTFIAGPSKTADIEQSLVLGAHGPKSLIVFLINK
jgi:L-lactate dehydrogenase complex protein LldG